MRKRFLALAGFAMTNADAVGPLAGITAPVDFGLDGSSNGASITDSIP